MKAFEKRDKPMFTDGYVRLFTYKRTKSSFDAVKNATALSDLEFVCKLAYTQMSLRQADLEFAEATDHSLNMKVKTRHSGLAKEGQAAVIGNVLYNIYSLDTDRLSREDFLYMEEVREIAE